MLKLLLIGMGGFVGALARYGLTVWVMGHGHTLPFGTFSVNLVGCVLFGAGIGFIEAREMDEQLRAFLFIGILGAFTTFSTFSYEAFELIRSGDVGMAVAYTIGSVVIGLLVLWAGHWTMTRILAQFTFS